MKMKDQRKTEIRVGITVIIGLIIFIWILGWAKNFSLTSNQKILLVKFNSVSGLEKGDYVAVNGVRKGFVEDFNIQGDNVIVKLSIDNDVNLKKDAAFSISMLDLMGGKKVNINPGTSSEPLNYNEVQKGIFYADIPEVMSMLGNVEEDIPTIIKDIKITLGSLNNYLSDNNLNTDIKTSVSNLSKASQKLNILLDENRSSIKQLTENTVKLTENVNNFMVENKTSLNKSVEELRIVLSKTDSLLSKVNIFSDEVKNKKNNVGKILYDEKLYDNLSQSLTQINELTKILIEQLKGKGVNVDANIF
jgi:phospholipid/cholesterol/gamma-HCH transport system substrate-binding protein